MPSSERMPDPSFRTTRWTLVLNAGASTDESSRLALEDLCRTYWFPLYACARRKGLEHNAAEDAVQGLFAGMLARGDIGRADPDKGRFRAWLRTALQHHLANLAKAKRADKRGAGVTHVSLEMSGAAERYDSSAGAALSPEDLFDRTWALALLDEALRELRSDYVGRDKAELFDALAPTITAGEEPLDRTAIAERFGMTDGALKVAVHRLRERYREVLRRNVIDTLEDPEAFEQELGALFAALGG